MPSMTTGGQIDASPERTFAVFSDLRNAAGRVKAIQSLEVLTEGPIGKGTRFKETRVMFGRPHSETMEITGWDPPRSYTVGCDSCGARYESTYTFRPHAGGTAVEMTFNCTPLSFFAKLMSFASKPMMAACRKAFEADFAQLKAHAEASEPAAATP